MKKIEVGTSGLTKENLVALYSAVGWVKYTEDPDNLYQAVHNSTYVVTIRAGERLLALARSVSDDIAIHYLQDILVHPDCQHQGLGRKLLESCLQRFEHVRSHVILTDNEERQKLFYESLGYKNTIDLKKIPLNCYVMMSGVALE